MADPIGDFPERAGDEGVDAQAALAALLDEAGFAEHFEMLRDGRQGHLERLRELHHAFTAGGEAVEKLAARGVGDGSKNIGGCAWAGHRVSGPTTGRIRCRRGLRKWLASPRRSCT